MEIGECEAEGGDKRNNKRTKAREVMCKREKSECESVGTIECNTRPYLSKVESAKCVRGWCAVARFQQSKSSP